MGCQRALHEGRASLARSRTSPFIVLLLGVAALPACLPSVAFLAARKHCSRVLPRGHVGPRELGRTTEAVVEESLQLWEPLELPFMKADRSGGVVSQILELLVPMHLTDYRNIQATVQTKFGDLIRGRIAAVHLTGDDWRTRAGLTARKLTVAAHEGVQVDYGDLLRGRLTVVRPALGWAEAVFEPEDFGNFLVYDRVAAAAPVIDGERVTFEPWGVEFNAPAGQVFFTAWCVGKQLRLVLEAGEGDSVSVRVVGGMPDGHEALVIGKILARFFQNLELDLAGVEMRFFALGFSSMDRLHLRLRSTVHRIPNPFRDRI